MKRTFFMIPLFIMLAAFLFLIFAPGAVMASPEEQTSMNTPFVSVVTVAGPAWAVQSNLIKYDVEVRTVAAPCHSQPEVVSVLKCPVVGSSDYSLSTINTASGGIAPHPKFIM